MPWPSEKDLLSLLNNTNFLLLPWIESSIFLLHAFPPFAFSFRTSGYCHAKLVFSEFPFVLALVPVSITSHLLFLTYPSLDALTPFTSMIGKAVFQDAMLRGATCTKHEKLPPKSDWDS